MRPRLKSYVQEHRRIDYSTNGIELRFSAVIPKEEILYPGQSNDMRFRTGRSEGSGTEFDASAVADLNLSENAAELHKSTLNNPLWSSSDRTDDRGIDSASEMLSKYEADLAQKDELINALVRELEQAVEQLDRLRRTGNDRAHEGQPTTIFSSIREEAQPQIPDMSDLLQMAEQWHQIQPASLLSRIESQLASVHDLISNLRFDERPRVDPADIDDRDRRIPDEPDSTIDVERANVTIEESASSWESIKRQILGESPPLESVEPVEPVRPVGVPAEDRQIMKSVSEAPSPRDIDFGSADVEALRTAINERDEYIIQLNKIFRAKSAFTVPGDWATLANVPAEMQIRVEALIERLDVQVRLGEVEMSLERARVARERSLIQSEREQLEKHLRRLGVSSISELGNISAAPGTSSDRRWMRFLGPSAK